ncbi:hypothetical protein F4813DRAFT_397147 [Daldinia decipiens]|uniref:uncharacterized protein n=1 Tax=Daldinia decipiens TaxID=326647 RepID=UPI0020C1EC6E|nr:uncharacterized protein F4813DRAFT_397147 [Daldinia decipiens]KAI1656907.1 hypothetical protein F4813DRAFT_397147 [Daldinia decipiens]
MQSNNQQRDSQQPPSDWINERGRLRGSDIPARQAGSRRSIPAMAYDNDLGRLDSLEEFGQGNSIGSRRFSGTYDHAGSGWRTTFGTTRPEGSDILASFINERSSRDYREPLPHGAFPSHILDIESMRPRAIPNQDEIARFESSIFDPNRPSSWPTQLNDAREPSRPSTPDMPADDITYRLEYSPERTPTPDASGVFYPSDHLHGRWHRHNRFSQPFPQNRPTISSSTTMLPLERDRPASVAFDRLNRAYPSTESTSAHPRIPSSSTADSSQTLYPGLSTPIMTPTSNASDIDTDASVLRVNAVPEQAGNRVDELSTGNGSSSANGEGGARLDGSGHPAPIPVTISISIEFDDSMFDIQGYNVTTKPRSERV